MPLSATTLFAQLFGAKIGLGDGVDLTVYGESLLSGHCSLGNDTIIPDDIENIISLGTGAESKVTVQTDILLCPVLVGLADDEHLGEIRILCGILYALDPDDLGFEE